MRFASSLTCQTFPYLSSNRILTRATEFSDINVVFGFGHNMLILTYWNHGNIFHCIMSYYRDINVVKTIFQATDRKCIETEDMKEYVYTGRQQGYGYYTTLHLVVGIIKST